MRSHSMPSILKNFFAFALLFAVLLLPAQTVSATEDVGQYILSLDFDLPNHTVTGTAKITLPPNQAVNIFLNSLTLTGTLLQKADNSEHTLLSQNSTLHIQEDGDWRTIFISFTRQIQSENRNFLEPTGISLSSNWYPQPDRPMIYTVKARLPKDFLAVTESDYFPLRSLKDQVIAHYSKPLSAVHFAAGPYSLKKLAARDNLFVYTLFFKHHKGLADAYLQKAAEFINKYEALLGPFPYNHYVITANRLPTGLGMPTFTLLGDRLLPLPFIKELSLGHEIVHSWFGNSVEVNYSEGNWCEGLTSFLADHSFREEKGQGSENRKESISRYLSFAGKNREKAPLPLSAFTSASHYAKEAKAHRAVGYDRGAMLFFELRERMGSKNFYSGLRQFYKRYKDEEATWSDLQHSFESVCDENLNAFFSQRLQRTEIPSLQIRDAGTGNDGDNLNLNFILEQKTKEPFSLRVPILVKTNTTIFKVIKKLTEKNSAISIPLADRALEVTVDPEYTFMRELTQEELPPIWSQFLGGGKALVLFADQKTKAVYQPILEALSEMDLSFNSSDLVTDTDLAKENLLFLGTDQAACRALFGQINHSKDRLTLEVKGNPLNPDKTAVLLSSSSMEQSLAAAPKLSHYGKYSVLEFQQGRIVNKSINPSISGIHHILETEPVGAATRNLQSFYQLIEALAEKRVIYVGETHNSLADHLLQLRIIQALHKQKPSLAIGMEMFPVSSQAALDNYTLADPPSSERVFLKESKYFEVWGYDYRLFREIFLFAKQNRIPIIGLNQEKEIVSKVFHSGGTDSLSMEEQQSLPPDRNLSIEGYRKRLEKVYRLHSSKNGEMISGGFIQAQAIWDESMAVNIVRYLQNHEESTLVVLAGSQHTRKDSGIPPRVLRRMDIEQASILNVQSAGIPSTIASIADYFFLSDPVELPQKPLIGIVLQARDEEDPPGLEIEQLSPHGKAKVSGLLAGDILLTVNDQYIEKMSDLHIALLNSKAGDTIPVRINRREDNGWMEHLFGVELTTPPPGPFHP